MGVVQGAAGTIDFGPSQGGKQFFIVNGKYVEKHLPNGGREEKIWEFWEGGGYYRLPAL